MDLREFSRSCNDKAARFLEKTFGARVMTVPASYPMVQTEERKAMLRDPVFRRLDQAGHMGPQDFCFACLNVCPVGRGEATA